MFVNFATDLALRKFHDAKLFNYNLHNNKILQFVEIIWFYVQVDMLGKHFLIGYLKSDLIFPSHNCNLMCICITAASKYCEFCAGFRNIYQCMYILYVYL